MRLSEILPIRLRTNSYEYACDLGVRLKPYKKKDLSGKRDELRAVLYPLLALLAYLIAIGLYKFGFR